MQVLCNNPDGEGCVLGLDSSFFFFEKSDTEVQFALKPELQELPGVIVQYESKPDTVVLDNKDSTTDASPAGRDVDDNGGVADPIPTPQRWISSAGKHRRRVFCAACKFPVGYQMNTGPNNCPVVSFGISKVRLKGKASFRVTGGGKWLF